MAADEVLVGRVREHLAGDLSFSERRMFGGLAVMCNGNMAAGVIGDRLMVRVGRRLRSRESARWLVARWLPAK
jgi:TfoX/Sxy family transcriptional regulator of competence genes